MATIGAYLLSQNLGVPNVQPVITIASPRPGDVNFQTGFQAVMSQTRYENDRDLVPLVPPPVDFIGSVTHNPLLTLTPTSSTACRGSSTNAVWMLLQRERKSPTSDSANNIVG